MLVYSNLTQAIVLNNAIAQQFPPHYRFDTHFHRSVELLLCKSGTISFAIQGSEHILKPGQFIDMHPKKEISFLDQPSRFQFTHSLLPGFSPYPSVPLLNRGASVSA